jgi:rhodanese-related sulfurtransferase
MKKMKPSPKKTFPLWGWGILAVVVIAAIAIVISLRAAPAAGTGTTALAAMPSEVSVAEAAQKRDQGAFILDVRQPEEWTQFHIPGATLIPLGELPNRLNEVPKDKPIVVVCRTGHRSASGRDILLQAGFTSVTSMAGGVTEWQAQGLPIATGQ